MSDRVSVIIPAYNRADLIVETLESVAAQTLPVSEILIVDDCSTDQTSSVVASWLERNNAGTGQLKSLSENVGKPAAVNLALAESRGEFIVILDSDDVLLPDAVATQVAFLRRNEGCGMVFGFAYEMHNRTRTQILAGGFGLNEESGDVVKHTGDLLLRVNPVVSSSVMIRRVAFDVLGGMKPHLRIIHDWEYWIRISRRFPLGFVPSPLVYYRIDMMNSLSANRLSTFREVCALLVQESQGFPRKALLRSLRKHVRFNAAVALKDGKTAQALGILREGFSAALRLLRP